MGRIARVVPEVSLDQEFDYAVPSGMEVPLGAKVRVPFGARQIVGYVVDFPAQAGVPKLKEIAAVLPASLPAALIKLARWLADYYCAPLAVALKTVLPQAVRRADAAFKQRLWVMPLVAELPDEAAVALKKNKGQARAWQHLQENGAGWLSDLGEIATPGVWRALAERNLVSIEPRTQDP